MSAPSTGATSQSRAIAGLTWRTATTRARILSLLALAAALIAITATLGRSGGLDQPAGALNGFTLGLLLPITALLFGTAAFGDLVEDGTLVYLWMRPVRRRTTAVAVTAAALVLTALVVVPTGLVAALAGGAQADLVGATLAASALGVLAYVPLFVGLGLRVPRALMWGLGYVLIWEGAVSLSVEGLARLSVSAYTRSLLVGLGDASTEEWVVEPATAVLVLLAVGLAGVAWTARTLRTRDIP